MTGPDHITPGDDPILDGECPVVVGGGLRWHERRRQTVANALGELSGADQWADAIAEAARQKHGQGFLACLADRLHERVEERRG